MTLIPLSERQHSGIQHRVSYIWMAAIAAMARDADATAVFAILESAADQLQRLGPSSARILRDDGEEMRYRPEKQPWHRSDGRRQPVDDRDDPYSL